MIIQKFFSSEVENMVENSLSTKTDGHFQKNTIRVVNADNVIFNNGPKI